MAVKEYKKIGGRGYRYEGFFSWVATWCTLWLGEDHLLQIQHTGFSEEYRRFYFKDIQAIIMRKTKRALVWTISLSIFVAFGVGFELDVIDPAARIFWGCWIALFALLLLVNLAKGPTCICHIQTAVQTEQVPSLKRVKKSRKIITRIRDMIMTVQGALPAEEARARLLSGEQYPQASTNQGPGEENPALPSPAP